MKAIFLLFGLFTAVLTRSAFAEKNVSKVTFPKGVKHEAFDALLQKYVNQQGLVAYADWKASQADRKALDRYLAQFAAKSSAPAEGDEMAAAAINAYNAFAIRMILEHYPVDSIHEIKDAFSAKLHEIAAEKVSLEDIEHGTLRPAIGWRAHSALVCCARSCPPLARTAYTAEKVNAQIEAAYRVWLARDDLNKFLPDKKKVEISSVFKWFEKDFAKAGGVKNILGRFGPERHREFLVSGEYKVDHLSYHWGLNDQGGRGERYSQSKMLWDKLIQKFQ